MSIEVSSKANKSAKKLKASGLKAYDHFPTHNSYDKSTDGSVLEFSSDDFQKLRCIKLKNQLEELERYNDKIVVKLHRWQKRLRRLKIERNILFERIENTNYTKSSSRLDSDSDIPLKDAYITNQPQYNDSDSDSIIPLSVLAEEKSNVENEDRSGQNFQEYSSSIRKNRKNKRINDKTAKTFKDESVDGDILNTNNTLSERKKRAERDPNAPKRPANAFVMYCQEERLGLKTSATELSNSDITKHMNIKWKELPSGEKQKYFNRYEEMITNYKKEMLSYKSTASLAKTTDTPTRPQLSPSSTENHEENDESRIENNLTDKNDISFSLGSIPASPINSNISTKRKSRSPMNMGSPATDFDENPSKRLSLDEKRNSDQISAADDYSENEKSSTDDISIGGSSPKSLKGSSVANSPDKRIKAELE
ncbi:hypothetical protein BB561_001222 [Smittium simulii]|uniref:HMG box domain-containing protein n=1 Tax=Smittium simulii TaxID=133385 RepID=A0A2T9YVQ8_9FUNG|nr:hypothetical protein BB561_001222 [Smittium simulii]